MNISYAKRGLRQFQNEVFESMTNQFLELWKRGHTASYNINCSNGEAWMNISSYLGYQESDNHSQSENTKSKSAKRSKGSPSKLRRSKRRLESFLEKKRLESSQLQQPKSPDATSGIATTNINGNSDETSEKTTTKNNHLENPDNIQSQHVTTIDDTISEEPPATNFTADILLSEDKDSQSQSRSNEDDDEAANAQADEGGFFTTRKNLDDIQSQHVTANKEKENIPHVCHCEETGESRQNQQIIDALVQLVKCEPSELHEKVLSNMRLCIHNLQSGNIVTQLCDILENWGGNELDYCYEPSQLPTVFSEIIKKQEHIKFMDSWAIELEITYDEEHGTENSRTRKLISGFYKQVQDRDFSEARIPDT